MMEGDKVIIDRARLEQLEQESQMLKKNVEFIYVTHIYTPWNDQSVQHRYEGKDGCIKNIVETLNEATEEVKRLNMRLGAINEKINTASFIDRLGYLLTKEL